MPGRSGGQTWSEPVLDDRLVEPVCDASLMATDTPDGPLWLFANCASLKRTNETIRASRDEGQTWPIEKVLFPGHSAYPCLARLADGTFACLYERGEQHPMKAWLSQDSPPNGWRTERSSGELDRSKGARVITRASQGPLGG